MENATKYPEGTPKSFEALFISLRKIKVQGDLRGQMNRYSLAADRTKKAAPVKLFFFVIIYYISWT